MTRTLPDSGGAESVVRVSDRALSPVGRAKDLLFDMANTGPSGSAGGDDLPPSPPRDPARGKSKAKEVATKIKKRRLVDDTENWEATFAAVRAAEAIEAGRAPGFRIVDRSRSPAAPEGPPPPQPRRSGRVTRQARPPTTTAPASSTVTPAPKQKQKRVKKVALPVHGASTMITSHSEQPEEEEAGEEE